MSIQEESIANYNLGLSTDFESINDVKKLLIKSNMCKDESNISYTANAKSIIDSNISNQEIWGMKYENGIEIVTRKEYNSRMNEF